MKLSFEDLLELLIDEAAHSGAGLSGLDTVDELERQLIALHRQCEEDAWKYRELNK